MKKKEQKQRHREFVLLTAGEHQKLVEKLGADRAAFWIEELDDYLGLHERNRRKYDSHYRAICQWAKREARRTGSASSRSGEAVQGAAQRAAARFIEDLKRYPIPPEMPPAEWQIIYAVHQHFKLTWPQLRARLTEDTGLAEEVKAVYLAEAQRAQSKA